MAIPGVTADQLDREERRKHTMSNNFIYKADSGDESAGENKEGQAGNTKSKLKGLARLLHLEVVCQIMSQSQSRLGVFGGDLNFSKLRQFLETDVSSKNKLYIIDEYGISLKPDVDGGREGQLSWCNKENSSVSLHPGGGFAFWIGPDMGDELEPLDAVSPDKADIRRHILVGTLSVAMTEALRTAAWTTIEEAPYPAALLRYPKRLIFDVGPRMREYLNKRDGAAQEEAWYHPGMRDRIQVRVPY